VIGTTSQAKVMRCVDDSLALWKSAEDAVCMWLAWMEANSQIGAMVTDESEDGIYCKGLCCIY